MRIRTIGEVMTTDVVRGCASTSLGDVARLLDAHHVSGLPVVDSDDKVIGVISRNDLTRRQAPGSGLRRALSVLHLRPAHGRRPAKRTWARGWTAEQLMSTPAVSVHPGQDVAQAARIMKRRQISRLPVVDEEDRLIGIVTRRSLLRAFLHSDEDIREQVGCRVRANARLAPGHPLHVSVRDGLVTLEGRVTGNGDISPAVWSAWRVDGVVGVVNELVASSEPGAEAKLWD